MTEKEEREISDLLSCPKFGYCIEDHYELCKALFKVGYDAGLDEGTHLDMEAIINAYTLGLTDKTKKGEN